MSDDSRAVVTLPKDAARKHELLHELAWINLLSRAGDMEGQDGLVPVDVSVDAAGREDAVADAGGALEALLELVLAATSAHAPTAHQVSALAADSVITTDGWCGSDLFLQCSECKGDRVVLEIKGPTAQINYSKHRKIYQTEKYRQAYKEDPSLPCECMSLPDGPYLVLLDARSRDRTAVLVEEGIPEHALEGWAWLKYRDVLSQQPFRQDAVGAWLLNAH
jgi:hypothetical protein